MGVSSECLNHLWRIFSLFSKEMLEKLLMKGHLLERERDPQSNSVPNLVERISKTALTRIKASTKPLFATSSAACMLSFPKTKQVGKTNLVFWRGTVSEYIENTNLDCSVTSSKTQKEQEKHFAFFFFL